MQICSGSDGFPVCVPPPGAPPPGVAINPGDPWVSSILGDNAQTTTSSGEVIDYQVLWFDDPAFPNPSDYVVVTRRVDNPSDVTMNTPVGYN
jgi:hypothetical protein